MRTRWRPAVVLAVATALAAAIGHPAAQTTTTPSTINRLEKDSTYATGCFGPCDCAVVESAMRGTFVLTRDGSDPLFTYYKITDVNWTVAGNPELRITGSGVYKIGGEFAVEQRLEMDLVVGNAPVQHFDSGPVYGPAPFPEINITITLNGGQACHDTLIHVHSKPVPPSEIYPYRMLLGSSFERGCFAPCLCPVDEQRSVTGTFALVELQASPTVREFAVVDVRWLARAPTAAMSDITLRGFGDYRIFVQSTALEQQLGLDLSVDGGDLTHFDSGRVPGGNRFPRIDATISINGGYCFDTVIQVHAAPGEPTSRLKIEDSLN